MSEIKGLSLEEVTSGGQVTIRGKLYPVRPIDGFGMQLIHSTPGSDRVAMIRAMYRVAARCLGVSFDEVFGTEDAPGFSEAEVLQVTEVAQQQVKAVQSERAAKNSEPAGGRNEVDAPTLGVS